MPPFLAGSAESSELSKLVGLRDTSNSDQNDGIPIICKNGRSSLILSVPPAIQVQGVCLLGSRVDSPFLCLTDPFLGPSKVLICGPSKDPSSGYLCIPKVRRILYLKGTLSGSISVGQGGKGV